VAAALLTAVVVAGMMLDFQSDKSELAAIMDKQYALLAENLPELDAGSNPKRALAGYLADQQGGVQQADFIELLHAYARLQREVNTVKTGRIQYQNGSLAINVESRDLKTMENLRNRLIQGDFPAVIENLNISPEATTGRVVIGAGRK
jgi:type II secretory pathway component PulL